MEFCEGNVRAFVTLFLYGPGIFSRGCCVKVEFLALEAIKEMLWSTYCILGTGLDFGTTTQIKKDFCSPGLYMSVSASI